MDRALHRAFRRRVLENIEADLAREDKLAEAERTDVIPKVAEVIAGARARGECGKAWLFGSFAWGRPGERSDIDVLVERCADPDVLGAELWRACERPAHVVELEKAPQSLVERAQRDGKPL